MQNVRQNSVHDFPVDDLAKNSIDRKRVVISSSASGQFSRYFSHPDLIPKRCLRQVSVGLTAASIYFRAVFIPNFAVSVGFLCRFLPCAALGFSHTSIDIPALLAVVLH